VPFCLFASYPLFTLGVRCPELITVVIVSALNLGKNATRRNLSTFYTVNCALIAVSAVAWIIVIMSGTSKHYFSIKDDIPARGDSEGSSLYETLVPKNRNGKVLKETFLEEKYDSPGKKGGSEISKECRIFIMNEDSKSTDEIVKAQISSREKEKQRILPLRLALFAIMFFSIFQAPFFAYVTSSVKDRDIEQILYFVRLFSDLLGRPLTRVLRFPFLKVNSLHLRTCALFVIVLHWKYYFVLYLNDS
jgi:hypothetical protein